MSEKKSILIISGVDPTGEAGFILDTACVISEGMYPLGVPTSVVAENSREVRSIHPVKNEVFIEALKAAVEEIKVSGVKIGYVTDELISPLAQFLKEFKEKLGVIVVDPVLSASSGFEFHRKIEVLKELLEAADVITPNRDEFRAIFGLEPDRKECAEILQYDKTVVVTGLKTERRTIELKIFEKGRVKSFIHQYIEREVRGTGCAFSSLLVCQLAEGKKIDEAVKEASLKLLSYIKRSIPLETGKYRLIF